MYARTDLLLLPYSSISSSDAFKHTCSSSALVVQQPDPLNVADPGKHIYMVKPGRRREQTL